MTTPALASRPTNATWINASIITGSAIFVFALTVCAIFLPQWRVEAKLLNALDHRVEPVRDYQGLGRQAWIGVRYDGKGL